MNPELIERVMALTKLSVRDAMTVAGALEAENEDVETIRPAAIVAKSRELGFEVEIEGEQAAQGEASAGPEISMNPAEVLTEVYMVMPRVLCPNMPKIGKAPEEAREHFSELIDSLPEEVQALLVKIDLLEGKATFWLRDEANDVDRPIGPIDLTRYEDEDALNEAFTVLLKRLPRVLAADFN